MNIEAICLSAAGSLCVQLLNLTDLSKAPQSKRPDFTDYAYYLPYIIFPIVSAVIGYAYFDDKHPVNKMLALQLGASSPLIFKSLISSIPPEIIRKRN